MLTASQTPVQVSVSFDLSEIGGIAA